MARFGGVATIRRVAPDIYNLTTGTVSETVVDVTVRGVLEGLSLQLALETYNKYFQEHIIT
jgi:hypothetical protein